MAAQTRLRLPHIMPITPPLQRLTETPIWSASQYLLPLSVLDLSGNLRELVDTLMLKVKEFEQEDTKHNSALGCLYNRFS